MSRLHPHPATLSRDAFVARFGGIYEHSPWIAEDCHRAGLPEGADRPATLAAALGAVVDAAPEARRLELIRAHPDLAGRLGVAGSLTEASSEEQASAGLDRCSAEDYAAFTRLNEAYRARFGFPFIMAVRGRSRAEILRAFEARLANDPAGEFATAIAEIHRIALLRLRAMAEETP